MFEAALITTAKIRRNLRRHGACVCVCVCVCIMECYLVIKKNKILPFAAAWMDLEGIEISQAEKDKYHMISLTCGI